MSRSDANSAGRRDPCTIADILYPVADSELRAELEAYRREWESVNGPTDLTRRYTSQLSPQERQLLKTTDAKRYFDGLPPFVQDYLRGKMENAKMLGMLDDMPSTYLGLYLVGGMSRARL